MTRHEFGCARCFGDDGAEAWRALQSRRVQTLIDESHFSVRLSACECGQHFAIVFTEQIDWSGGDDDQDWLSMPVSPDDVSRLRGASEAEIPGILTKLGAERRFLVRIHGTRGELVHHWREGNFQIGPHD